MQNKSMIMYANQKIFDRNDWDMPFKMESKFLWVPVGPEMIEQNFYSVMQGCVESNDNMLMPFVEDETMEKVFDIKKGSTVGFKDNYPGVLAAMTIERDLD